MEQKKIYYHLKQLKREYLDWYIVGFVDGEGSFSVSITKHPDARFGWMIDPVFQIYQHENHREVLELIREVLKTGTIRFKSKEKSNTLDFSVENFRSLKEKIIPFFKRYQLIVKNDDFKKFCQIIELMDKKAHYTIEGFKKIIRIAHLMNQQGKQRIYSEEYIFERMENKLKNKLFRESSETNTSNPVIYGNDIVQTR